MRNPNKPCIFCNIKKSGSIIENVLAYVSCDSYPVTDLHCLIIPKRHVKNYFDLTKDEIIACHQLIKKIKKEIEKKDKKVNGFNVGINSGKSCWPIYYALSYSFDSKKKRGCGQSSRWSKICDTFKATLHS